MARPKRKLRWVKFDIDRLLFGTTREELTTAQRAIWYDLILLAGQANDDGWIIPPISALPRILKSRRRIVEAAIAKCIECGKLKLDETGHFVQVRSFTKYNPARWETAYYKDDVGVLEDKVDNSTKLQNSTRNITEERRYRGDKKRVDTEEKQSNQRKPLPLHSLNDDFEDRPLIYTLWEGLTSRPVALLLYESLRPYEETDSAVLEYAFQQAAERNIHTRFI